MTCSERDLVPTIWLPDPRIRSEREQARFRLHLVRHKSMLKHRIHATMLTFGHPCPVTDLFGVAGRELLDRLEIPDPWRQSVDASIDLIDYLERQIAEINRDLKASGAEHPYVPLLLTVPGIGWVLAFTIASEIGDITRFPSARKLCGYTGHARACTSPVRRIAAVRSPSKGPSTCAGRCSRPRCTPSDTRPTTSAISAKKRLGRQRGAKVAQIDIARKLTEAIWHMLMNDQPFAPTPASGGATNRLAA